MVKVKQFSVSDVAWRVSSGGGVGVMIATQHGIVSSGQQKDQYWLPHDKWAFHAHATEGAVIAPELQNIRDMILEKKYIEKDHPKISIQKCHQLHVGSVSPKVKARCNCRDRKCRPLQCGCAKKHARCSSTCLCQGGCTGNPYNGK